jgi:alkylhydroperoxidase family enzyme
MLEPDPRPPTPERPAPGGTDDTVATVVDALARGDLASAPVSPAERALLELVERITRHAYRVTAADVQRVRDAGWSDPQIAEAVYITALFAFFNRVADAFGISGQGYGGPRPTWPPEDAPA